MSTISERQNKPANLEKLAAQRTLYSQAKVWQGISIIISMPLMVVITLLALFFNSQSQAQNWGFAQTNLEWLVVLTSFLVLLANDLVLMPIVDNKKELASRIQESFDCDVLGLPWNYIVGEVPEPAVIRRYSKKLLQNLKQKKGLQNWYAEQVNKVPEEAGKIICQLSNVSWDKSLRERYQKGILSFGIIIIMMLIFTKIYTNINFPEWIIYILAPSFPVFSTLIQHWRMQQVSIETLKRMHEKANSEWKNYLETQNKFRTNARQIQDEIYKHRRTNMPIFNCLYYWNWNRQEEEQSYTAEYYINEYEKVFNKVGS